MFHVLRFIRNTQGAAAAPPKTEDLTVPKGAYFPALRSIFGVASHTMPLGEAIGMFAAVAYGVMIVAALTLPETRGKQLES